MPDFAMCVGASCGLKATCRRYTATPGRHQSYFAELPGVLDPDNGWECDQWMPELERGKDDDDDWFF